MFGNGRGAKKTERRRCRRRRRRGESGQARACTGECSLEGAGQATEIIESYARVAGGRDGGGGAVLKWVIKTIFFIFFFVRKTNIVLL